MRTQILKIQQTKHDIINGKKNNLSHSNATNIITIKLLHKVWCFRQTLLKLVYPCQVTLLDAPINILLCRYIPEKKLKYFTGGWAENLHALFQNEQNIIYI